MENSVLGIHHITAITDDPQRNIDFYVGILGEIKCRGHALSHEDLDQAKAWLSAQVSK